jgi:hypothetical protein
LETFPVLGGGNVSLTEHRVAFNITPFKLCRFLPPPVPSLPEILPEVFAALPVSSASTLKEIFPEVFAGRPVSSGAGNISLTCPTCCPGCARVFNGSFERVCRVYVGFIRHRFGIKLVYFHNVGYVGFIRFSLRLNFLYCT